MPQGILFIYRKEPTFAVKQSNNNMANNKVEPQKENELNVLSDSVPCEARQETILAVLRQRYFSTSDSVLAIRLGWIREFSSVM